MKLFQKKPKLSPAEQEKKSAQKLIPIKGLDSGVIITPDNRLVQVCKVDAVNTELMSNREFNALVENYEAVLKSINFETQVTIVSQPVDLSEYIKNQQEILKNTKNFHRKRLLNSYIDYSRGMEKSRKVIQRQRYIIFDEPIKKPDEKGYQEALQDLQEKTDHIIQSFKDLDLAVDPVNDVEAVRLLHIFFDFEGAQNSPITNTNVSQIITGGDQDDEHI